MRGEDRIAGREATKEEQVTEAVDLEAVKQTQQTMAFARVGPEGEHALVDDLRGLVERFDRGGERAMLVDSDYLEVVAVRA